MEQALIKASKLEKSEIVVSMLVYYGDKSTYPKIGWHYGRPFKEIFCRFLINALFLECIVKDEGTSQKKECEFPFRFLGKTYHGCIDFIEIRNGRKIPGKPWCSTKVSGSNRKHVSGGGHYGDCNSSCEMAEEAEKRLKGGTVMLDEY